MRLCKHDQYIAITEILEDKWSSNSVRIATKRVDRDIEHYVIKFQKSPRYKDWFYLSGTDIRRSPIMPNGKYGQVYEVPMRWSKPFTADKNCKCEQMMFAV